MLASISMMGDPYGVGRLAVQPHDHRQVGNRAHRAQYIRVEDDHSLANFAAWGALPRGSGSSAVKIGFCKTCAMRDPSFVTVFLQGVDQDMPIPRR